jgi:hypothetical protein
MTAPPDGDHVIRQNLAPLAPDDPSPEGTSFVFDVPAWRIEENVGGMPFPSSLYWANLEPLLVPPSRIPLGDGTHGVYDWLDNPRSRGGCEWRRITADGVNFTVTKFIYNTGAHPPQPDVTGKAVYMYTEGEPEPEEPPPCDAEEASRRSAVGRAGDPPPNPECCPVEQNSSYPRLMPAGETGGGGEDPCDTGSDDECDGTLEDEDCDWELCITIDWYFDNLYLYSTEECSPLY